MKSMQNSEQNGSPGRLIWLKVLEANKPADIVYHWQQWFDSKRIKHEMRKLPKGLTLFRAMTTEEHAAFLAIEAPVTEQAKEAAINDGQQ